MSSVRIAEFRCPTGAGPDRIIVDWDKGEGYRAKERTDNEIATDLVFYQGDLDGAIRAALRRFRKYRR